MVIAGLLGGAAACEDGALEADPYGCMSAGGAACFELPIDTLYAIDDTGAVVDATLGCGPPQVVMSTSPITIGGLTVNLDETLAVEDVQIEAYADVGLTTPLFETSSGADASWSATVNAMPSTVSIGLGKADRLPMLHLARPIDIAASVTTDVQLVTPTRDEVAARLASVGDFFTLGSSQLFGTVHDCAGHRLASVLVNAAPVTAKLGSKRFESGVRTYYALDSGALARRPQLHETTGNGGFMITNLRPGPHFIQLWGFPTRADLEIDGEGIRLLGETEIMVFEGESGLTLPVRTH